MAPRIGVPLREHEHGAATSSWRGFRKEPGAHAVVLGVRRGDRAGKRQRVAREGVVLARRDVEEGAAVRDRAVGPALEPSGWIIYAGGGGIDPVEAPVEGAHHPISRRRGESA